MGGGTETNVDTLLSLLLLCVSSCMFGLDLHVVGGARKGGCCQLLLWRIDTSELVRLVGHLSQPFQDHLAWEQLSPLAGQRSPHYCDYCDYREAEDQHDGKLNVSQLRLRDL